MATITGKRFQMTDGAATPINLFPYTVSEAVYGLNNSISNAISNALSTISLSTYAGTSAIGSSVQPVYYNGSALVATDLSTTYAPYNAAGYLPLTGGTMSNANLVTNLNADLLHGFQFEVSEGLDYNNITWNTILFSASNNVANRPLDDFTYGIRLKQQGEPNIYFTDLATGLSTDALYYRRHSYPDGFGNWHQVAFTDSNVASATKLQTARTIWGQSFDGTANVTGAMSSVTNIDSLLYFDTTNSELRMPPYTTIGWFYDGTDKSNAPYITREYGSYSDETKGDMVFSAGRWASSDLTAFKFVTTSAAYAMCIKNSGNVGIGTVSPTQKLHVVGNILSTGDQIISSDLTLKMNLKDVTYSVSDIAKCRAVTFDWKDGHGHSAGSIAQDWKPLIPELVHGEKGGMTLAYGQIALVNSILEAREIERLKERVAELEQQLKMRS